MTRGSNDQIVTIGNDPSGEATIELVREWLSSG